MVAIDKFGCIHDDTCIDKPFACDANPDVWCCDDKWAFWSLKMVCFIKQFINASFLKSWYIYSVIAFQHELRSELYACLKYDRHHRNLTISPLIAKGGGYEEPWAVCRLVNWKLTWYANSVHVNSWSQCILHFVPCGTKVCIRVYKGGTWTWGQPAYSWTECSRVMPAEQWIINVTNCLQ